MVRLPAFCSHCGTIFPSGINVQGPSTQVRIARVQQTCPRCGFMGEVPDGTYDVVRNTLQFLSGPDISRERLWRLQEIIRRGQEAGRPAEAIVATVAEEVPQATRLIAELRASPVARLSLLLAVIEFILSHGKDLPWDEVAEMVKYIVENAVSYT